MYPIQSAIEGSRKLEFIIMATHESSLLIHPIGFLNLQGTFSLKSSKTNMSQRVPNLRNLFSGKNWGKFQFSSYNPSHPQLMIP